MPREAPATTARTLQTALRLSPALARLLAARGWSDVAAVTEFLFPRLEHTHSPWLMRGMEAAVTRLLAAAGAREPILILGDYDVDGVMATVIVRQALGALGAQVAWRLPHRLEEGYGIPAGAIEDAAAGGVKLVLTVDTGIRDAARLARAAELGVDVIVTDHHLAGAELPAALAILNPHQPGCGYPDKGLCGTGIAFKLVQALLERSGKLAEAWPPMLQSYLKLVALGTIADSVPLLGENRVLARFGLQGLAQPVNPGLRALLELALPNQAGDAAPIRSMDVAFRIAPRLNAAGRLGAADEVVELFSATPERARAIAQSLEALNQRRQKLCESAVAEIEAELAADPALQADALLLLARAGWHRGVVGIVASRVLGRTGKPALVAALEPGPEGVLYAHGSGRAPAGFHLLAALETQSALFDEGGRYGGHAQAVGFSLPADRLDALRAGLQQAAAAAGLAPASAPRAAAGLELQLGELTADLLRDLQRLEPYGEGNPEPVFRISGAALTADPRVLKEKHLKLALDQAGARAEALAWNCWRDGRWNPGPAWPAYGELRAGARVDLDVRVEVSRHPQFGERVQLIVLGLAPAAAPNAIELKSPAAAAGHL